MRGVILSPAGIPVAGATVLVENIKFFDVTHVNWTATTDAAGAFETPLPGPGFYDVFVTYPFVDFERWAFPGVWFDAVPDTLRPTPMVQAGRVDFRFDATVQPTHGRGELSYQFERPGALPGSAAIAFRMLADGSFTAAVPGPGWYHARFSAFHGNSETSFEPIGRFAWNGSDTVRFSSPLQPLDLELTVGGQPAPAFDGELRVFALLGPFTLSTVRMTGRVDIRDGRLRVWSYAGDGTVVVTPSTRQSFVAQILYASLWQPPIVLELGAHELKFLVKTTGGEPVAGASVELWRLDEAPLLWQATTNGEGRSSVHLNTGAYTVRASWAAATPAESTLAIERDTELVLQLPSAPPTDTPLAR